MTMALNSVSSAKLESDQNCRLCHAQKPGTSNANSRSPADAEW